MDDLLAGPGSKLKKFPSRLHGRGRRQADQIHETMFNIKEKFKTLRLLDFGD
jgi:hypothetical protein